MKKSEIKVGRRYRDNKHMVREVVAEGPQYVLYPSQDESDCLRFRVVAKPKHRFGGGSLIVGREYNCTRASFAAWAKEDVTEPAS